MLGSHVFDVVFSDEYRFQLCTNDHRRRVWRRPKQRDDLAFTIACHIGPQPRVMVWGAIPFKQMNLFAYPERHTYKPMVRQRHSENCFATVPFAVPWPYFSEDKGRLHSESVAMNSLTACQILPWPARAPDFS
ncbi:transposable element Tc1 transposase [Trichonephila clavipes]|nr:transposable element Tc1 transposase [Trichonephila clavipes]